MKNGDQAIAVTEGCVYSTKNRNIIFEFKDKNLIISVAGKQIGNYKILNSKGLILEIKIGAKKDTLLYVSPYDGFGTLSLYNHCGIISVSSSR